MAKKKSDDQNGENLPEEEPNFEDPEDYVDDVDEEGTSIEKENFFFDSSMA